MSIFICNGLVILRHSVVLLLALVVAVALVVVLSCFPRSVCACAYCCLLLTTIQSWMHACIITTRPSYMGSIEVMNKRAKNERSAKKAIGCWT